jgi:hypothetical protein
MDRRIEAMKAAVESEVPLIARPLERGSIEAQTRRNLLCNTDLVPILAGKFDTSGLRSMMEPLAGHMGAMDLALTETANMAIRLMERSLSRLIEA